MSRTEPFLPRLVRLASAFAMVTCTAGGILNTLAGNFAFGVILLLLAALTACAFVINTRAIRRGRVPRCAPDYSLIAAMEREVWEEALGHQGAPEAGALVPVAFPRTHPGQLPPGRVAPGRGMTVRVGSPDGYGDLDLAIPPARPSLPRVDLVAVHSLQHTLTVFCGTPDIMPPPPCLPAGYEVLARIRIPPGMTEILACHITQMATTQGNPWNVR